MLLDQRRLQAAKAACKEARSLFERLTYQAEVMLADCTLADIALLEGDIAAARGLIAETVAALQTEAYAAWEYLPQAVVSCRAVLLANGEAELAATLVEMGRAGVLESAEMISDPQLRHAFLYNVPVHRALLADAS